MADIRPRANASFPHLRVALAQTEATATVGLAERAVALATETAEAVAHFETHATTLPADTVTKVVLLAETETTAATEGALTASDQTDTVAVRTGAVAIGAVTAHVAVPSRANPSLAAAEIGELLEPPTVTEPQQQHHPLRTLVDVIIVKVMLFRKAVATPLAAPHRETPEAASTDNSDAHSEQVRMTCTHRRVEVGMLVETMMELQPNLAHHVDHARIPSAEHRSDARAPGRTMNSSRAPLPLESGPPLADQCPGMIWP